MHVKQPHPPPPIELCKGITKRACNICVVLMEGLILKLEKLKLNKYLNLLSHNQLRYLLTYLPIYLPTYLMTTYLPHLLTYDTYPLTLVVT